MERMDHTILRPVDVLVLAINKSKTLSVNSDGQRRIEILLSDTKYTVNVPDRTENPKSITLFY